MLKPSYTQPGASKYGAQMGRATRHNSAQESPRFYLRRVRLDSGGYDPGGAYWGIDEPLYWFASEDGETEGYLRATSRESAKRQIRENYPDARFWR